MRNKAWITLVVLFGGACLASAGFGSTTLFFKKASHPKLSAKKWSKLSATAKEGYCVGCDSCALTRTKASRNCTFADFCSDCNPAYVNFPTTLANNPLASYNKMISTATSPVQSLTSTLNFGFKSADAAPSIKTLEAFVKEVVAPVFPSAVVTVNKLATGLKRALEEKEANLPRRFLASCGTQNNLLMSADIVYNTNLPFYQANSLINSLTAPLSVFFNQICSFQINTAASLNLPTLPIFDVTDLWKPVIPGVVDTVFQPVISKDYAKDLLTPTEGAAVYVDLNGDGIKDYAFLTGTTTAVVLFGNGTDFPAQGGVTFEVPLASTLLRAHDVNNDGKVDLIALTPFKSAYGEPTLFIYTNNGTAFNVASSISLKAFTDAADIAFGKTLNGDSFQEVAVLGKADKKITIFSAADSTLAFTEVYSTATSTRPVGFGYANFEAEKLGQLVVYDAFGGFTIFWPNPNKSVSYKVMSKGLALALSQNQQTSRTEIAVAGVDNSGTPNIQLSSMPFGRLFSFYREMSYEEKAALTTTWTKKLADATFNSFKDAAYKADIAAANQALAKITTSMSTRFLTYYHEVGFDYFVRADIGLQVFLEQLTVDQATAIDSLGLPLPSGIYDYSKVYDWNKVQNDIGFSNLDTVRITNYLSGPGVNKFGLNKFVVTLGLDVPLLTSLPQSPAVGEEVVKLVFDGMIFRPIVEVGKVDLGESQPSLVFSDSDGRIFQVPPYKSSKSVEYLKQDTVVIAEKSDPKFIHAGPDPNTGLQYFIATGGLSGSILLKPKSVSPSGGSGSGGAGTTGSGNTQQPSFPGTSLGSEDWFGENTAEPSFPEPSTPEPSADAQDNGAGVSNTAAPSFEWETSEPSFPGDNGDLTDLIGTIEPSFGSSELPGWDSGNGGAGTSSVDGTPIPTWSASPVPPFEQGGSADSGEMNKTPEPTWFDTSLPSIPGMGGIGGNGGNGGSGGNDNEPGVASVDGTPEPTWFDTSYPSVPENDNEPGVASTDSTPEPTWFDTSFPSTPGFGGIGGGTGTAGTGGSGSGGGAGASAEGTPEPTWFDTAFPSFEGSELPGYKPEDLTPESSFDLGNPVATPLPTLDGTWFNTPFPSFESSLEGTGLLYPDLPDFIDETKLTDEEKMPYMLSTPIPTIDGTFVDTLYPNEESYNGLEGDILEGTANPTWSDTLYPSVEGEEMPGLEGPDGTPLGTPDFTFTMTNEGQTEDPYFPTPFSPLGLLPDANP